MNTKSGSRDGRGLKAWLIGGAGLEGGRQACREQILMHQSQRLRPDRARLVFETKLGMKGRAFK